MGKQIPFDRLRKRELSRREFHRGLAAVGLATVTLPLISGKAAAEGEVTYFTWGGYEVPDLFPAYIEKYGGPPKVNLFGDEEEGLQKIRAGFRPDLGHPCVGSAGRWRDAGVSMAIDTSRLKHWPDVWDDLKAMKGTVFNGENWFVPTDWGNSSILFRTDLVDPKYVETDTWAILLDERYKGRVAVLDDVDAAFAVSALMAGIEDPFNMSDAEIAEARKVLEIIHRNSRFWWTDQTSLEQALASGELVAAYAWMASVLKLKEQGLPVKYMNPKEGILNWVCGLVRLKNGSGPEEAVYDLIDAWLDPRAGQFLIDTYGYGHSNRKSFDLVSKERLEQLGLATPGAMLSQGVFFAVTPPEIKEKLITIFEEVKAGI